MAHRYSGYAKVQIHWNEKQNQYVAKVNTPDFPNFSTLYITVSAPENLEPANSSEAYDEAARAVISLAKTELSELAAYRIEQPYVGRTPEQNWPPEMSTAELDKWTEQELMEFSSYVSQHPVRAGREFFPERPPQYSTVAKDLASYASNRAEMLACKRRENKYGAANYEWICNTIKWALPLWVD